MRRRQSVGNRMLAIALDPGSTAPLYVQIYESIRRSIVEGRLTPGSFLPSSRTLADDLAIARSTVVGAYEQLHAEGYLEGTVGAGTSHQENVVFPTLVTCTTLRLLAGAACLLLAAGAVALAVAG